MIYAEPETMKWETEGFTFLHTLARTVTMAFKNWCPKTSSKDEQGERMEQKTRANKTGPRLLRWWMIVACLVASWLCWWVVNTWLEPKPLWSRELPKKKVFQPVFEDTIAGKVLILETLLSEDGRKKSVAFVILDRNSGQELYQTVVDDTDMADNYVPFLNTPRLLNDAVWRIAIQRKNNARFFQLRCWKYREKADETVVHTWQEPQGQALQNIAWPALSRVIVLRYLITPMVFEIDLNPNPFKSFAIKCLLEQHLLELPSWCESWQLPDETERLPRLLARWAIPSSRRNTSPVVSDDGQWAAFPESNSVPGKVAQRARASGRTSFQGDELLSLFRSDSKGILIFNTATGKLEYQYHDGAIHSAFAGWHGACFATMSDQAIPEKRLSLKEIEDAATARNFNLAWETLAHRCSSFRLSHDGIHALNWSNAIPHDRSQWFFGDGHDQFNGVCSLTDHSNYFTLKEDGDRLSALRTANVAADQTRRWAGWLGNTKQYLMNQPNQYMQWFKKSEGKWAWLDSLIKLVKPHIRLVNDVVVVDENAGRPLQHPFPMYPCIIFPNPSTHFYLFDLVMKDDEVEHGTLHAYPLPLRLFSPWWGRIVACVPFVMLVVYVIGRKHSVIRMWRHSQTKA